MKKIFFNDKYGLTDAVLTGAKTQTRRIVPQKAFDAWNDIDDGDEYSSSVYAASSEAKMRNFLLKYAQYKVGEVVAVAQPYRYIDGKSDKYLNEWCGIVACEGLNGVGYNNKMFVKADLMPHKIKITDIRVQRLQDISNEDCLAEGITTKIEGKFEVGNGYGWDTTIERLKRDTFLTPRAAYAALIDRISGKGTWKINPLVFVYDFKLVK